MASFPGEVAVAIVVVGVILVLFGVLIGFLLYYGCGAVCCCGREKYDVCERAAEELARKQRQSCGGPVIGGGDSVSLNPFLHSDTSGAEIHSCPVTPLVAASVVMHKDAAAADAHLGSSEKKEEVSVFEVPKETLVVGEAAVAAAVAGESTCSAATPSTACFYYPSETQEGTRTPLPADKDDTESPREL